MTPPAEALAKHFDPAHIDDSLGGRIPIAELWSFEQYGQRMAALSRALQDIPVEQREVVMLVGLEQMTYEEVARILDIPIGTVMSRLHRGRERLRHAYDGQTGPSIRRVK